MGLIILTLQPFCSQCYIWKVSAKVARASMRERERGFTRVGDSAQHWPSRAYILLSLSSFAVLIILISHCPSTAAPCALILLLILSLFTIQTRQSRKLLIQRVALSATLRPSSANQKPLRWILMLSLSLSFFYFLLNRMMIICDSKEFIFWELKGCTKWIFCVCVYDIFVECAFQQFLITQTRSRRFFNLQKKKEKQ